MMATLYSGSPRVVVLSEHLYRGLLRAYPAAFRRDYAAQMAQVFRSLCRDAYRRAGTAGVLRLWPAVLWDWLSTMIGEYRATGREDDELPLPTSERPLMNERYPQQQRRPLRYAMLAGAALTLFLVLYGLVRYPSSIDVDTPMTLGLIAVELALYGKAALYVASVGSRAALRGGVLCGLGVGAVWLVYNLDANLGPALTVALGLPINMDLAGLGLVIYHVVTVSSGIGTFALCTVAGLLAARGGGRFEDSVRAGLLAGLVGALITVITMFISTYPLMDSVLKINLSDPGFLRSHMHDVLAWTIQDNMGGTFFELLFGALFGAVFGGFGGLLARGGALSGAPALRQ
jgi:hypothetical protein